MAAGKDQGKRSKGKCPYCGRHFTLRDKSDWRIRAHNVKGTGRRCGGSGQVPS
jgi:hypothetical protein